MNEDDLPIEITTQVGPWAMVPVWILRAGLTAGEVVVYVALRSFASQAGTAHPRTATIAARAGVSTRSVERAITRFRELGLIRTARRHRDDGGLAGLTYQLRDTPPTGLSGPPDTGVGTPPTPVSATPPTPVSEQEHTKKRTPQRNTKPLLTADAASAGSRRDLAREFDTWWPHYPRKVGRKEALAAYVKARREATADQLLQAVQAYAADPNQPVDRSKIPHASTWLNGGRWDDEPLPAPVSTATERVAAAASLFDRMAALDATDQRLALAGRGRTSPWDRP